jgi:hypothetical protein
MRILGVALPLVGGFLTSWPYSNPDYEVIGIHIQVIAFWGLALVVCLTVFVGALLLRSWWSLLILPVAAYVGTVLGNVVFSLIQGGVPMMQEWIGNWIGGFLNIIGLVVMIVFLPLIVVASIGTAISPWLKKRIQLYKEQHQ